MNTLSVGQTYLIDAHFDKAIRLIRSALERQELSIAAELEVHGRGDSSRWKKAGLSRLLLVDSPLLLFEALALDKAAGVFLPLHVLVSSDGEQTHVSCVELPDLFEVRVPAGSSRPLSVLRNRIAIALESITSHAGGGPNPGGRL